MKFIKSSLCWAIVLLCLACQPSSVDQNKTETPNEMNDEENSYYTEQHRPQFHFSPENNWMNDPNGMVYYEGEYHLFYQYYPDSTVWGPMHWGHAISPDLVHWEHLPIALYPDSLGFIFSGSAVIDWKNTSGFGSTEQPPMIAIFTYHDPVAAKAQQNNVESQGIAYSTDKGRTWTKYDGNPVVPNTDLIRDFRDPKVIWDEDSDQWVMVFAAQDHSMFWGSKDLKNWQHLSDFGTEWGSHAGVWECPDFFPIKVAGSGEKKWVLLQSINPGSVNGGSGTQYFVGDFDGKEFVLDKRFVPFVQDEKAIWLDYGRDNYAGVTWSDIPKDDGRRIFLGWMSNWNYAQIVPTTNWRSAMTVARELILQEEKEGYRLASQAVPELEQLRGLEFHLNNTIIEGQLDFKDQLGFSPQLSEVVLEFDIAGSTANDFGIRLSNALGENYDFGYTISQNGFYSDRTKAGKRDFSEKFAPEVYRLPRTSIDQTIRLHIFFDTSSIEVFADGGKTTLTDIFFPNQAFDQLSIFSNKGSVRLKSADFYQLKSIWN